MKVMGNVADRSRVKHCSVTLASNSHRKKRPQITTWVLFRLFF